MLIKNRLIFFLICLAIVFSVSNCKKDKSSKDGNAYVNFYIDVSSTQYMTLNNIGGYVYVTGGANGIIIYRLGNEDYLAFDRTCTLRSDSCQLLTVDKSGLYIVDIKCKSKFIILDGTPDAKSPSQVPLLRYHTAFDGQNLHIYN